MGGNDPFLFCLGRPFFGQLILTLGCFPIYSDSQRPSLELRTLIFPVYLNSYVWQGSGPMMTTYTVRRQVREDCQHRSTLLLMIAAAALIEIKEEGKFDNAFQTTQRPI
jgi:hypothetical protein